MSEERKYTAEQVEAIAAARQAFKDGRQVDIYDRDGLLAEQFSSAELVEIHRRNVASGSPAQLHRKGRGQ